MTVRPSVAHSSAMTHIRDNDTSICLALNTIKTEVSDILFHKTKVESIALHKGVMHAFPSEHLLFSIRNSAGKLRMVWYTQEKDVYPYEGRYVELLFKDTPLVRVQSSGCPTCQSLLAAGYGIPEDSIEIKEALQALYQPYTNLNHALKHLQPILGLLQPGLYILSFSEYFPTTGDGSFFWDAPEELTPYEATAELYDHENYRVLPCFPCFFYPSQSVEKYNSKRVKYYRQMIQAGQTPPPALAYSLYGYMSVLLDGHHRACACALEGIQVPCLTLSRPGRIWRNGVAHMVWPDGSEDIVANLLSPKWQKLFEHQIEGEQTKSRPSTTHPIKFPHNWHAEYSTAISRYPTCWEAGSLMLYPQIQLSADGLRMLAYNDDYNEIFIATCLLEYLARQPAIDTKGLAMEFTESWNPAPLRLAAFKILDRIKDDPDVDDLMVQILVNCERKDDPIYRIADRHWN